MPNPFTEATRGERWETGLGAVSMEQLRAPASLDWLRYEAKPVDVSLGTFALKSMFDRALITLIVDGKYRDVIGLLVRTWPELLTGVRANGATDGFPTVVSATDDRQSARKPLAKIDTVPDAKRAAR